MQRPEAAAGVTQEGLAVVREPKEEGRPPSGADSASVGWKEGLKLPLQCFQEVESFYLFYELARTLGRAERWFLSVRSIRR